MTKRQKDPNSPKQPLTAYMLFYIEQSKKHVSKEERKGENMGKYVGYLWRKLENKKKYQDKFEQNKLTYEKEMQKFKKNKTELKKSPKNAYVFFTKKNRNLIKEIEGLTDFGDISKAVARYWHLLSDEKKSKYRKMADDDRKTF